jgi:endonuclease/exonuclease/phosphatase family metal-dependent hydrolase
MARRPRSYTGAEERAVAQTLRFLLAPGNAGAKIALLLLIVAVALGYWFWQRSRAPSPSSASPPATSTSQIRIATWNLRKFSERDRPGQHPPDLVAIAKIIKDANFDLVAIQEVQQQGQMVQKLRRQLNEPWRHAVTDRTGNNERYAFVWRADRIDVLDEPQLYAGPGAESFSRVPAVARFRAGQFDFTLLSVHLWYGDKSNNPQRRTEAQALTRLAQELASRGPDRDVIVLGDFNEVRSDGNLPLFESIGWRRLSADPTNLGSSEAFDNILIDPRFTRESLNRAGVIRFDETLYANDDARAAQDVSDHRPVWADFATTGPDDD